MEQALPLQPDWLNFNRFALRAEKTLPLGPFRWGGPVRSSSGGGWCSGVPAFLAA